MMGWSGGTFTREHDWTTDEAGGVDIEASRMDTEDDNFAAGINACIHKGGQNAATADLPMGTNKHTGVGNGTARNHYTALGQLQDAGAIYAAAGGTGNVITLTLSPAITAYATGQRFFFKASAANTGATTINVNGVGAKNIFVDGAACVGGEIQSGQIYCISYDGTQFQLIGVRRGFVGCLATNSGAQSIPNNTSTALTFDGEDFDTHAIHNTVSNTDRLTIPAGFGGIWRIDWALYWASNASGYRFAGVRKNGAGDTYYQSDRRQPPISGAGVVMGASFIVELAAADYLQAMALQTSGGALDASVATFGATFLGKV